MYKVHWRQKRTKAVKKQKLEYEDYRKLISDQVGMRDKKIKWMPFREDVMVTREPNNKAAKPWDRAACKRWNLQYVQIFPKLPQKMDRYYKRI